MLRKSIAAWAVLAALAVSTGARAKEGMWIPTLLGAVEDEMRAYGMRISAEDIYAVNHSSLKDAIVHFGGGCTAEFVSAEGLIFTNHHCGYDQIAAHSTVEHDYLRDGFWAMDRAAELPNPGLTATLIDRIEDVTARVLAVPAAERDAVRKAIVAEATAGNGLSGKVVAFDFGNSYFLITTRTYSDVRLVGAPPSAIGKFGGDTDNWVWPRHTGDFSVFRVYAGADNAPAAYSTNNVPFRPAHHLPVSLKGVQEGDFTMVFGFPGTTEQYLTAAAVQHLTERLNPARIGMRDAGLAVINAARASDPALRIAYAPKQSDVANAWKKWMGQNRGLRELDAVRRKQELESEFARRAAAAGRTDLQQLVPAIDEINRELFPLLEARSLYVELMFYGPDMLSVAADFAPLLAGWDGMEEKARTEALAERRTAVEAWMRQSRPDIEQALWAALLDRLRAEARDAAWFGPVDELMDGAAADAYVRDACTKSVFADPTRLLALLERPSDKAWKRLAADPVYRFATAFKDAYATAVAPAYQRLVKDRDVRMAEYTAGLRTLFPERQFFPDANSTLRLTYGKVEGSAPHDGAMYTPFTTSRGLLQKHIPGDADFGLPPRLIDLLTARTWEGYAPAGSDLPVCFTGSNHTTGGNSGSPALNADGHLIGINFDRSWESTMSDVLFDGSRCRNIMVDSRYVLWVIDVYGGAGHLVDEMTLVR